MDEQTFKNILDEALEPIKGGLSVVKETLDQHTDILENRVLPSVTETELTLKSYADSYKINQHNIERIDTRLTTVEDKLGIEPPEDLKVPHFSVK